MSYADQENDSLSALYEVSSRGSVSELDILIGRDPLILHKLSLTTFTDTPLHISALLGHLDFTKSLLRHKSQLALELDRSKRTPLHLASAQGHVEIVHVLLQTYEDACLMSDQDGRTPLHYAAMRGRTEIATMLIRAKPESLMVLDGSGKTVLHLCVEHNHLETLKTLVQVGDLIGDDFLNERDLHHGNTILHLAVTLKQVETIRYLFSMSKIREEAHIENKMGCNALDMLVDAGIKNNEENQTQSLPSQSTNKKYWGKLFESGKKFLQHQGSRLEHMRGMLSLAATMISTMTYDAITNVNHPPDGIVAFDHFIRFITFNSISFVTSLSITLLLVSGVPLKNEITMGILSIGTGITLTFLMLSYLYGVLMLGSAVLVIGNASVVVYWLGLLGLIVIFTIIRVIYWLKVK